MTINRKGRAGWHQATSNTSNSTLNFTDLIRRMKAAIVTLPPWILIAAGLTLYLIPHCHMGGT